MRLVSVIIAAVLSAGAFAMPAPEPEVGTNATTIGDFANMTTDAVETMERVPTWALRRMQRYCDEADTRCLWKFVLDTRDRDPKTCQLLIQGNDKIPASQMDRKGMRCGNEKTQYLLSVHWYGDFGPGNGLTVVTIMDYWEKQVAWVVYNDKLLENNRLVDPDLSGYRQKLPLCQGCG
ncbi:hypothetical protein BJ170DRAFT_500674 [Xylariales sp. AK1849]|nr:hypothetical protein BJ170DRAFT_500674 [Xylariales sp. AK1849]